MSSLDNLTPEDLLILTNVLAVALSKDKTADEINVLGNFIVGIGCLMLTLAAQEQYIEAQKQPSKSPTNDDITIG
ncbi:hypothetical protein [Clostridium cibarium]|uniref:Phage holin n=1 Tax=Clostridium cibarium TaxID=2762247 RepID=A0ABR8PTG1_9CLOT|nr:hypothetical protein [Clostridium cibarium]MBD7911457.1 hypothetical protein [Clostridium cibarium]